MTELKTKRLRLRQWTADDLEALVVFPFLPEVAVVAAELGDQPNQPF